MFLYSASGSMTGLTSVCVTGVSPESAARVWPAASPARARFPRPGPWPGSAMARAPGTVAENSAISRCGGSACARQSEQAEARGLGHRRGPRRAAEPGVDVREVPVNRVLAEHQPAGDLPVAAALGDQAPPIELAHGQRL